MRVRFTLAIVALLLATDPVHTQDFRKDYNAFLRGDYTTAQTEWRPLAERDLFPVIRRQSLTDETLSLLAHLKFYRIKQPVRD